MSFLVLLLIAAICGAMGQAIAGYSVGGCLISTVVGFIGALIGKWLAAQMGLTYLMPLEIGGQTFPVVWSIFGSALLSIAIGVINRGRKHLR